MFRFVKLIPAIILLGLLAACGGGAYKEPSPIPSRLGDENIKLGSPYTISGVTYHPRVDLYYDVTGNASWYGSDFHGKRTANGEVFDMNALTAAHTTLPMPSYVRVTNLANGRSLVLRVNDRGPFVSNRILDVSRRAAQLLGFENKGIERVRVQVVQPDGSPYEKPVDRGLTPIPERTAEQVIEETRLAIPPDIEEGPAYTFDDSPPVIGDGFDIYVQVAAFSSEENARLFRRQLEGIGPTVIKAAEINNNLWYRVQLGAYQAMDEALKVLDRVKNLGFSDAHIFTEPGS